MVSISKSGLRTARFAEANEKKCRFEGIYFSHPSSDTFGEQVTEFRLAVGRALEMYAPVPGADIVTPIPDSANFIAMGYAQNGRSGLYLPVIMRSHYVGRTFIAATQAKREEARAAKFNFTARLIRGKRLVVVDDSVVRGNTLPSVVRTLRELGAAEVHARVGSPPIKYPCTYGINTPTSKDLISAHFSPEELCEKIGADSLKFLPLDILKSLSSNPERFCFSCMTGEYWDTPQQ